MKVSPAQETKDGTILLVHVQPSAARTECVGFHGGALKIRVAVPPVDGAANEALVRFLAERCAIVRARITIQSGADGRRKRVHLRGVTADRLMARLMPGDGAGR
jgi:uncharacterized protein